MSGKKVVPLHLVIGTRLREIRESEGKTQEEVAAAARAWGLPWTQSTVAAVEAGSREVSFQFELFPLLLSMGRPLSDLLPASPEERIEVSVGQDVPARTLRRILTTKVDRPRRNYRLKAETGAFVIPDALGTAEKKAARRLGVQALAVAEAARRLWKRSLPEERDARVNARGASARTLQALRGHVTRELIEELRKVIE